MSFRQGRYSEAQALATNAVALTNSASSYALGVLAHTEFRVGQLSAATNAWNSATAYGSAERLLSSFPDLPLPPGFYARSWGNASFGATLDRSLASSAGDTGQTNLALQLARIEAALFRARPTLFPKEPLTLSAYLNSLAWLMDCNDLYEEAYPIARRASELAPKSGFIADTLAHAAYGTRRWQEAVDAWQRALAPGSDFTHPDKECSQDGAKLADAKAKAAAGKTGLP